jgi:2-polyprenyl-3-methyl-5-hydroxy-6-metoxy-1,4-benzoquinol methylase
LKHGWFEIDGLQTGEHKLETRLHGLRLLASHVKDKTILDLGCAEGLISSWLYDQGPARWVDGVEKHPPYLAQARAMHAGSPAFRFFQCDVNDQEFDDLILTKLLPAYDIVLCLCLAHKLKRPRDFLLKAARLCNRFFALHLPYDIIDDVRSNHVKVDPTKEIFEPLGFKCIVHVVDPTPAAPLSRRIYERG